MDGSRTRKEKVADSKISGYVCMGRQFSKGLYDIVLTGVSTSTSSSTSSIRKTEEFDK